MITMRFLTGMSPDKGMSDGYFHLILSRRSGNFEWGRFLLRVKRARQHLNMDFIEDYCVTKVIISKVKGAKKRHGRWNVDGELRDTSVLKAEVIPCCIELFCRGVEPEKRHVLRPARSSSRHKRAFSLKKNNKVAPNSKPRKSD